MPKRKQFRTVDKWNAPQQATPKAVLASLPPISRKITLTSDHDPKERVLDPTLEALESQWF